jgi:hypothetical protein
MSYTNEDCTIDKNNDLNYFVCTLGEALEVQQKSSHSYQTINDFFNLQKDSNPDVPAVAFPVPGSNYEWFREIYSASNCSKPGFFH